MKEPEAIFYEWNGNLYQLVLANKEIAKLTNLTVQQQNARDFALTPDGREAVYTATERGQADLWRIDLRGGAARRLTNDKETDGFPVWAADGGRVFYSSVREGKQRLYQVDAAGGAPAPVTSNDQQCRVLDLTATSSRLLCYDQREESDIFAVQVATGGERQITADLGAECWPSVSPNGQILAFHSLPGERFDWNVNKMLLQLQPLNGSQTPIQLAADAYNAQWSPDGKHLAFFRQAYSFWVAPSFGGEAKQLVAAGVSYGGQANSPPYNRLQSKDFSWSPDSSQLAYGTRQNESLNIWRVTLAGAPPEQLTGNTDRQVVVSAPHWSSDGQRVVYLQDTGKPSTPAQPRWSLQVAGQAAPLLQSATTLRLLGWADNQHVLLAALNAASTTQAATADLLLSALSGAAPHPVGTLTNVIFTSLQADSTGQQVACVRNEDGRHDLWVLPLAGARPGALRQLRKLTNNTDPNLYYGSPAWSPDGKTIYYDRQTRWNMLTMVDKLD